jgi:hypothetical protein
MSKVVSSILPIAGAVIGSIVPGLGTALGATLGGALGGVGSGILNHEGIGGDLLSGAIGGLGGYVGADALGSIGSGGATGALSITQQGVSDPITAISNAMTATGTDTATGAAQALGYSGTNAMLSAANPAWLTTGAAMQGMASNATGGLIGGSNAPQVGSFTGTVGSAPTSAASRALAQLGMSGASGTGGAGLGTLGSLMSVGSGIYGLSNAIQEQQLAKQLESSNQYTSGYAAQLNALMKNPSSITSQPGYEAGLEAVQRSMAAQGYQGSGNMAAALQQYGGNFFNNAVTQLEGLASPTGGVQALQGANLANTSSSQALAALGYGAAGLGL